jgi:hypothetical protein
VVGRGLQQLIPPRRRLHHQPDAERKNYPTIYTPKAQIPGPSALPPPERRPERRGAADLAVGGKGNLGYSSFSSLVHCSRKERREADPNASLHL